MKYEVTPIVGEDLSRQTPFIIEVLDEADLIDVLMGHQQSPAPIKWYYEWHEITH
jgi:hypothetical protein